MTKNEQKALLREIADNLLKSMERDIDQDRVPEEWNGIELRLWLYDAVSDNSVYQTSRKRKSDYQTIRLKRNLT